MAIVGPIRWFASGHERQVQLGVGSEARHAENGARRVPESVVKHGWGGADADWWCAWCCAVLWRF